MSNHSEEQLNQETKESIAVKIAIDFGLVYKCNIHNIICNSESYNIEETSEYIDTLIENNDKSIQIFKNNKDDLLEYIHSIIENSVEECPQCNKLLYQ